MSRLRGAELERMAVDDARSMVHPRAAHLIDYHARDYGMHAARKWATGEPATGKLLAGGANPATRLFAPRPPADLLPVDLDEWTTGTVLRINPKFIESGQGAAWTLALSVRSMVFDTLSLYVEWTFADTMQHATKLYTENVGRITNGVEQRVDAMLYLDHGLLRFQSFSAGDRVSWIEYKMPEEWMGKLRGQHQQVFKRVVSSLYDAEDDAAEEPAAKFPRW